MSDSNDTNGSTPSLEASVSPYNTYGLATQGFVWAAISSVSGDWGKGHVKRVNGVSPDESGNVGVASISSLDYSGDLNQINSDFTAIIAGESGHKVLTDKDETRIRSSIQTQFDSVCALFPSEATSENKLADKTYVNNQIAAKAETYRGSWTNWTSVPTNSDQYPPDAVGSRKPKNGDYLVVLDVSDYTERPITGTWRFRYVGSWDASGKGGWNAEYEMSHIAFTQEQWDSINSGMTGAKLTSFIASSARWDSASHEFETVSSGLYKVMFEVETTSANNRSVFGTVSSLSADWENSTTVVEGSSANWDSAYTEISETSANNRSVYTTVSESSGAWKESSETVAASSSEWDSVYHSVFGSSANWDNAFSKVDSSSSDWDSVYASVRESSAKWNESEGSTRAYTDMIGTSALTSAKKYADEIASPIRVKSDEAYSLMNASSANWNDAFTEVSSTSSDYRNLYAAFEANSGKYGSAYSTTFGSSANWQSTFVTVSSLSATWNEAAGSTKEYTNMMATSALTTANVYTDEKCRTIYDSFKAYSDFVATSALTSSKAYTDHVLDTALSGDREYTRFIAASALSSAKTYSDVLSAATLESAIAYADYSSYSSYSSSCEYTDTSCLALSGTLSAYAESTAADALESANIYSAFIASSALTSAREYADSLSEFTAASALSAANAYTDAITGRINRTVTYDVPWNSTEGISEYSQRFQNPVNGDVIILKKELYQGSTDNFRFTSFTYCSGNWCAMNGDYDTKSVYFTEDLITTQNIGNIEINPFTGNATISSKGKNVNTVFNELFRVEKDPIVTLPSLSASTENFGTYEVGSVVVPRVTVSKSIGKYEYGPVSTSDVFMLSATFNGYTRVRNPSNPTIEFQETLITDIMSSESHFLFATVSGGYNDDSVVPVTNLGNPSEDKKITEGIAEFRTSEYICGYRKIFYGTYNDNKNTSDFNSAVIRSLQNSTTTIPATSDEITLTYPISAKCAVFAVPSFIGDVHKITDSNGFGANIINSFDKIYIDVMGANSATPIPYAVYVKNSSIGNTIPNKYTLSFKD